MKQMKLRKVSPVRLVTAVEMQRGVDAEEVALTLRDMLERAERGETVGLVAVEVRPDGATASIMGPVPDFQRVLAGVRLLEHSLIRKLAV